MSALAPAALVLALAAWVWAWFRFLAFLCDQRKPRARLGRCKR